MMGLGFEMYYFGDHAQQRPHLKKLHLNSDLNDEKEATRQSTRDRKHNGECECLRNREKSSVAGTQGTK